MKREKVLPLPDDLTLDGKKIIDRGTDSDVIEIGSGLVLKVYQWIDDPNELRVYVDGTNRLSREADRVYELYQGNGRTILVNCSVQDYFPEIYKIHDYKYGRSCLAVLQQEVLGPTYQAMLRFPRIGDFEFGNIFTEERERIEEFFSLNGALNSMEYLIEHYTRQCRAIMGYVNRYAIDLLPLNLKIRSQRENELDILVTDLCGSIEDLFKIN